MPQDPRALIRLVVVDDHTLFRRGVVALLASDGRFEVVAEAGDATQAQQAVQQTQPDVVLLDNHLPGVHGVDALPDLVKAAPNARVLMLTMSEDEADLAAALARGASGYLLKTADIGELGDAIVAAMSGSASLSAPMLAKLAVALRLGAGPRPDTAEASAPASAPPPASEQGRLDQLSPRERETLQLVAQGCSNKQIARELGIAETTVKIHVQNLLRKLELESRVHAAAWYSRLGVDPAGRG